ncbi:MAG: hypothetical protein AAF491_11750, partial [Verrucomicrobiota bacterium]
MEVLETVKGWLEVIGLKAAAPWILALIVIVIGFYVAKILEKLVKKALSKTSFDDKLAKLLGQDCDGCEKGFSKFVFYLFMLFVVYFGLSIAGQSEAVAPLKTTLDNLFDFIPRILAAAVIGFVAWILATLVRNILEGILTA